MQVKNKSNFSIEDSLIQPRAEAEIAFILKEDIQGPGITKEDVILATDKIVPCFEIVDSRIDDWKIKIQDTIADNASCGIFVLGEGSSSPEKFPMDELEVVVHKNGEFLSSGLVLPFKVIQQKQLHGLLTLWVNMISHCSKVNLFYQDR